MFAKKDRPKLKPAEHKEKSEMQSHSRVAGIICATFSADNKKRILDFGSINQETINFFGQFSCQYNVIDLYGQLLETGVISDKSASVDLTEEPDKTIEQCFEQFELQIKQTILNYDAYKYDAIFLWDLLNYLEDWQVKRIFKLLEPLCHWKTNILAIFPIAKQMTEKPFVCLMLDYDLIQYKVRVGSVGMVKNPEHEKFGLSHLSGGFDLSHSSLSKHGLKECLFAIKRQEKS